MNQVTITELEVTCHMAPTQLEGKLSNGCIIYARSRYSGFYVEIRREHVNKPFLVMRGNCAEDAFTCMSVENLKKMTELYVESIDWNPVYS